MFELLNLLKWMLFDLFRSRRSLEAEIVVLRQQLNVLRRCAPKRPALSRFDRLILILLYSARAERPRCGHNYAARDDRTLASRWLSGVLALESSRTTNRQTSSGARSPAIDPRDGVANPLWGAPRIHGELLKLGTDIGQTSVAKYMARRRRPPSQDWRTFLRNHADGIASIDLFVVPTISFQLLYGLLVLKLDRRRLLWTAVTAHPTAEWIARQVTEAIGWQDAPQYLIRDRDRVYSEAFTRRIRAMGIRDRPTAPRSPWQNGYAERLIGSIRRECLDHLVVFSERHLRHVLRSYAEYYNATRTHLSVGKDAPIPRAVQDLGTILPLPVLGGLHHHYVRI